MVIQKHQQPQGPPTKEQLRLMQMQLQQQQEKKVLQQQ
jgi:hypothetical protein